MLVTRNARRNKLSAPRWRRASVCGAAASCGAAAPHPFAIFFTVLLARSYCLYRISRSSPLVHARAAPSLWQPGIKTGISIIALRHSA